MEGIIMTAFVVTRKVDIPSDKVWNLCGDFAKSPGPGVLVEVEEKGNAGSNNVGAIRTITIGSVKVRERLVSVDPPRTFSYTVLSGAPMMGHLGKAEFIPQGAATEIRWSAEFKPRVPGTGWIVGMVTRKAINHLIDEIEKAAR